MSSHVLTHDVDKMTTHCLLSWGANSHGQLGLNHQSEQCPSPQPVDLSHTTLHPERILKVRGGAGHSLILDDSGWIYSCGWNKKGQTGVGLEKEIVTEFRSIDCHLLGDDVKDVACGWDNSMALTSTGGLFAWGSNAFGQLGRDPGDLPCTGRPVRVETSGKKVKRVSMGLRHTALVTEDDRVLVAGAGSKGQLGLGDRVASSCCFTEVPGVENVLDVSCGQFHTIALTKTGELFVWGNNKHGQLGIDPTIRTTVPVPVRINSENVKFSPDTEIQSGWTHNVALTEGVVSTWGRNSYGQLGTPIRESHWNLEKSLEISGKVKGVAVGSEHTLALTDSGKIFSWGWNEHGNCGNGNTDDVLSPGEVPLPNRSVGIVVGAGAGHSFALIRMS